MNKLTIASLVYFTMFGSAIAATNSPLTPTNSVNVEFFGVVTNTTCDFNVDIDGIQKNIIDLGESRTNNTGSANKGPETNFKLVLANNADATCSGTNGTEKFYVSWGGPFDDTGLVNASGSATGAYATLASVNSETANQMVTRSNSTSTFVKTELANGLQYKAQLVGGNTPGSFGAVATYGVSYF